MNLFFLILYVTASLPMLFGALCVYKYFRHGTSVYKLVTNLFVSTMAGLVLLCAWPDFLVVRLCNILLIAGILVTSVAGFSIGISRVFAIPPIFLVIFFGVAELSYLATIDARFRIVVQDVDGNPVDIEAGEMALHNHPSSYFDAYYFVEGVKKGEGEFYFGLLRWLQNKGDWKFPEEFHDPDGNLLGDLNWKPAKWSEWPQRVIVQ